MQLYRKGETILSSKNGPRSKMLENAHCFPDRFLFLCVGAEKVV